MNVRQHARGRTLVALPQQTRPRSGVRLLARSYRGIQRHLLLGCAPDTTASEMVRVAPTDAAPVQASCTPAPRSPWMVVFATREEADAYTRTLERSLPPEERATFLVRAVDSAESLLAATEEARLIEAASGLPVYWLDLRAGVEGP